MITSIQLKLCNLYKITISSEEVDEQTNKQMSIRKIFLYPKFEPYFGEKNRAETFKGILVKDISGLIVDSSLNSL